MLLDRGYRSPVGNALPGADRARIWAKMRQPLSNEHLLSPVLSPECLTLARKSAQNLTGKRFGSKLLSYRDRFAGSAEARPVRTRGTFWPSVRNPDRDAAP